MTSSSLPEGMTEVDYEAIEAAVTETVRGRWFLAEFARRNRGAEVKLMLDAMGRLETLVTTNQARTALPSSEPSIRLMVQRIKEIAADLDRTAREMRMQGIAPHLCDPIELQARAVAGLMRTGAPSGLPVAQRGGEAAPRLLQEGAAKDVMPPASTSETVAAPLSPDARLKVFSGLDRLPLTQKLALFT